MFIKLPGIEIQITLLTRKEKVRRIMAKESKIAAIKWLRSVTGWGLNKAYLYVKDLEGDGNNLKNP